MIVIEAKTAHINSTGISFLSYAKRYQDAANAVNDSTGDQLGIDIVPYQLVAQALELLLKSYIWLVEGKGNKEIANKYRHNIEKLWRHSKERGILEHVEGSGVRDEAIKVIGKYYKGKQLCYLDIEMTYVGFGELRAMPESFDVLSTLNQDLILKLKPLLFSKAQTSN